MNVTVTGRLLNDLRQLMEGGQEDPEFECEYKYILRAQFMSSFVGFWVCVVTATLFIMYHHYSCLSGFLLASCMCVLHSAFAMLSSPPSSSMATVVFSGVWGIATIMSYWICYVMYSRHHKRWKTGLDSSGLFRISLIMTSLILLNVCIAFFGHLPRLEEMHNGSVQCIIIDEEEAPKQ